MLIVATRERDAASAQIEGLRRELSLYLSVPAEGNLPRTRTTMTRVGRMPPVPVTQSENVNDGRPIVVASGPSMHGLGRGDFERHLPPLADGVTNGEMTLDEIM